MCFECILLKPGLLQPGFHPAGLRRGGSGPGLQASISESGGRNCTIVGVPWPGVSFGMLDPECGACQEHVSASAEEAWSLLTRQGTPMIQ